MTGGNRQVTEDLSDVLHNLSAKFKIAQDGLSDKTPADGIDPSTHEALNKSHATTQKALDHGSKVSDKGHKFTRDAKDQADESAADINGVQAKTELSSGQVAAQPQVVAPAPQQAPMAAMPTMPSMPAMPTMPTMPSGMGAGGGAGGGRGFSAPNFSGGSGGGDHGGVQASETAYTRPHGPSVFQNFDAQQMKNAKQIVNAGLNRGDVRRRDIQIALMTSMQETNIRRLANPNVPDSLECDNDGTGTDHDSTGPFQQRQTWGDTADLMDPYTSADKFFDALVKIPDRDSMDMGAVAQAVQRSAAPGAYSKHEEQAGQLLDEIFAA
ncbi:MAG: hypothetical protein WCE30_08245 [Mycobacterium sp.]